MRIKISIIFILFLNYSLCFAQDIDYAKQILENVCSPEFHGRGYSFNADKITSEYLQKEFKNLGLKNFDTSYIQKFDISVNTIFGKNTILLDDSILSPGKDYLISSTSNSISGKYKLIFITPEIIKDSAKFSETVKKDFSDKVVLIDTLGANVKNFNRLYNFITKENALKAKAVIQITENNLLYLPSRIRKDFVNIILKRDKFPKTIDSIDIVVETKFYKKYSTQNLISYLPGKTDSFIVFSGHYDHLGHNGAKTFFPGANDNGSGIAMVLNLAKHFSELNQKPEYSIAFMFFGGEELGLLGSKYYTENPFFPLEKIKFLINLDMVGTGSKGIQIVNGSVFRNEFDKLVEINKKKKYLPHIKIRGAATNSDHYFFYDKGVKSFFIYTLGDYKEYHNIYDKPEVLPLTEFEDLIKLLIDFVKEVN